MHNIIHIVAIVLLSCFVCMCGVACALVAVCVREFIEARGRPWLSSDHSPPPLSETGSLTESESYTCLSLPSAGILGTLLCPAWALEMEIHILMLAWQTLH